MRRLFFTLTALLVAAPLAFAQSPTAEQIPYQGYLTDSGGPLTATLDVTFTLGDGSTTWSETAAVSVEEGVFTHYLGSVEAIDGIDFGADVELTLTIDPTGANETVGPFPLGAVPVAYEALNGGGFALPFSGTTDTSGGAFQVSNTSSAGIGLGVQRAGGFGLFIGSTGSGGVVVDTAGDTDGDGVPDNDNIPGVAVLNAGGPGLFVDEATFGFEARSTELAGVFVDLVGDRDGDGIPDDGVGIGVAIGDVGGFGVSIGSTGFRGYNVSNAGTVGFLVGQAGTDGVIVGEAGDRGLYVERATTGIEIGSTASDGLRIGVTGDTDSDGIPDDLSDGILVENAGGDGISVNNAGGDGFYANQVGLTGLFIFRAKDDGVSVGGERDGIFAIGDIDGDGTGLAAEFSGDVDVNGTFTATSKSFLIDHPSAPAERTLRHASVESAERLVTYSGTVTLDGSGAATVALPAYVEDLAADFRYGLTPIGAAMPDLHVGAEVAGGQFRIAGGAPGLKVSWRLDGVRQDAWARQNPLVVEEDKRPEDRGYYLSPEAFGQDRFEGIGIREHWAERQARMEAAEAQLARRAQQDAERELRDQQRAEAERQRELSLPVPTSFDGRRN